MDKPFWVFPKYKFGCGRNERQAQWAFCLVIDEIAMAYELAVLVANASIGLDEAWTTLFLAEEQLLL